MSEMNFESVENSRLTPEFSTESAAKGPEQSSDLLNFELVAQTIGKGTVLRLLPDSVELVKDDEVLASPVDYLSWGTPEAAPSTPSTNVTKQYEAAAKEDEEIREASKQEYIPFPSFIVINDATDEYREVDIDIAKLVIDEEVILNERAARPNGHVHTVSVDFESIIQKTAEKLGMQSSRLVIFSDPYVTSLRPSLPVQSTTFTKYEYGIEELDKKPLTDRRDVGALWEIQMSVNEAIAKVIRAQPTSKEVINPKAATLTFKLMELYEVPPIMPLIELAKRNGFIPLCFKREIQPGVEEFVIEVISDAYDTDSRKELASDRRLDIAIHNAYEISPEILPEL